MKLPRRQFLHLAAGAAALPAVSRIARAQTYPTRPITMNVPYAAGGPLDVMARVVADGLGRALGQTTAGSNWCLELPVWSMTICVAIVSSFLG